MDDDLLSEYDLAELPKNAVTGKYAERYNAGTNVVLLAPDMAGFFPKEEAENKALRLVIQLAELPVKTQPQAA